VFRQETGADQLAASGDTGQGVTVAVLDTGIANLPDFAGRLAGGVDLTGAGKPYQDSYGHGTFVAGLIAGDGSSLGGPGGPAGPDQGEAPGAILLREGYELVASVSVGIALTGPGKSADDVLRDADVAMYEAKARDRGGGYRVFDQAAMGRRSAERLHFEADLRKGIERDELEVRYQPVYSLAGQRIVGAEALVRWRHPEHGLIGPRRFIPVAEETGLILALGRYVLDQACREIRAIRDRLDLDLPISVNLSPRQFSDSSLLRQVSATLAEHGLPPRLLTFEITETMIMEDLPGARETMARLSGLGARLAIDDFGTGHSSLAYLKQFPVQAVKVDRSFVQGIAADPVDLAIVRAIVDLANALGIASVAEGVETQEQARMLRAAGCQVGQGFYFSRPLTAAEFEDLLTRHCSPEAAIRLGGVQHNEP
jgi:EAL domain-containing protein (putative c-di-GMP-specific phosphodiesterase class I)